MFTLGPVGFTAPLLLSALITLPILWLLLRAVPPAPLRRRFPGVALLLGLRDSAVEADRTPWWLLLLRIAALAAAIVAFAGPVLHPKQQAPGAGPLLIVMDASWADARDWPERQERVRMLLAEAGRDGRRAALIRLTDPPHALGFQAADAVASRVAGLQPQAWLPQQTAAWAQALPDEAFDSYWLSDGIDHPGREVLRAALAAKGNLRLYETPRPVVALHPARFEEDLVKIAASRVPMGAGLELMVSARGPDPAGIERELAQAPLLFPAGAAQAEASFALPPELRNRLTRFEITGLRSAAAVSLTDDSLKRRKVALVAAAPDREGLQLLSSTHYLRQALAPVADLIEGNLRDMVAATPDVVIMADIARISQTDTDALLDWLDGGGLLLRFAGPQMAGSELSRMSEDPLMPVRLREGGRTVGGAMSWGAPKALAPFSEESPFYGLDIPKDVEVIAQVLAQPDPELASRVIAALADGTPLVTRKVVGQGQVVLFHITANTDWSTLPLSGLFVAMLERLAVSTRPGLPEAATLLGQIWVPEVVLNAWGERGPAGDLPGIAGKDLVQALASGPHSALPPGLYSGADRRIALNVIGQDHVITATQWPAGSVIEGAEPARERALTGPILAAALLGLMVDILASLALSGRLVAGSGRLGAGLCLPLLALFLAQAPMARAQEAFADDAKALEATNGLALGYVLTGDTQLDEISRQGLIGLGDVLWQRTSVEPGPPIGVDIEADELAFYPFLYWPVTIDQPLPSAAAYDRLNDYLRTGGMILFDSRDGDNPSGTSPEVGHLQRLAAGLNIPALEPVPRDHVLTRTFYLLQDFPGRQTRGTVWVEAAPPDAEQVEGMPFRNLNDGVTPVVIGSNDWASAWAVDARGVPLLPVGRGFAGERQREMAYRFGVNLIMHVLTGNYKSDQVHVPALLERLGQ